MMTIEFLMKMLKITTMLTTVMMMIMVMVTTMMVMIVPHPAEDLLSFLVLWDAVKAKVEKSMSMSDCL
jgi:hypothetical protein